MSDPSFLSANGSVETALERITDYLDGVAETLADLSSSFVEIRHEQGLQSSFAPSALDELAQSLEPSCLTVLQRPAPRLIEGIGLVWVGTDDDSGMLWWRADNRVIARKHHVFNPSSDSYYDYRNSIWYQGALQRTGLSVVGPYIDAWGTDDHALTASVQISAEGRLLGVAAADLNLQTLTDQLDVILQDLPDTVLVGAEDRVIASNLALLSAGLRLEPYLQRTDRRTLVRSPLSITDWELVTLDAR